MPDVLADIFADAIAARAFPGGVVWLGRGDACHAHQAFGTTAYDDAPSRLVTSDTVYDLASLTKIYTSAAVFIALREAGLDVDEALSRFFPEFGGDKCGITLRHLLHHNSGIEFAIQALADTPLKTWLVRIASAPLHSPPGEHVLYSCTNFWLLARVVEKLCGAPLHALLQERVVEPLGLNCTTIEPLGDIAPTEVNEATGRACQGIVHDEAARAWHEQTGGLSGNAGLFGTAQDVACFLQCWNYEGEASGRQILHPDDVRASWHDVVDGRGLGWQMDNVSYMSHLAPPNCVGHMGFTGPTMFWHPRTGHIAVILNNRVYPTRNGPNRAIYHRRVAQWLWEHA